MPTKAEMYAQMAEQVATQLTGSWQEWAGFLTTAARLYKYPFHEQMMIYAQRPDATACAEYDLWNEKMGRYVRRGSKGIALVDDSGDRPRLRYVFDISDTGTREHSRTPWLWKLEDRHMDRVTAMLERTYDVTGDNLAQQLTDVAGKLAEEYWTENRQDFFYIVDGSFLEEYDEFNIGVQFKAAATVSITYALMSRCGLEPERYFDHEDFMAIFDFNTPATIGALGTAVSQINQQVLRQIGVTVRNVEREVIQERSNHDEQSHELHPERRLSDSRPEVERAAGETVGQVRQDAKNVSEGTPPDSLQSTVDEREVVSASERDRRDSHETNGTADASAGRESRSNGEAESKRSDEVGRSDEHLQSSGRGNPDDGTYQQLTLNLFLSENEQIQNIDEAESVVHTSSAFSFAQTDIDHVLRLGGNTDRQRERIVAAFEKQKPLNEMVDTLKSLYHGGNGLGSMSAWYADDGIHISHGRSVRDDKSAQIISWQAAAERIGELLESGQFASNVELAEAENYERTLLAEKLWNLYHDFSEEAREAVYLACLSDIRRNNFPEETRRLTEQLDDSTFRQTLTEEYAAFWTAYSQNRDLLRFHYHRPRAIWENLKDLALPRRTFTSEMAEVPSVKQFITEDEIDTAMTGGSGFSGGKGRIYTFFQESHTDKEKVDFLKHEYGMGGHSHALSGATHSSEDHDGKGLHYKKQDCPDVDLSWEKVSKRITGLIQKGRYLTEQELAEYAKIQAEKAPVEAETEKTIPQENITEAPENLNEPLKAPSQNEIDDALRTWNGNADSKRAVVRYMADHARERDTAAWLAHEYDGSDGKSLFVFKAANTREIELSWPKVQRRIAQLIQENHFLTEAEQLSVEKNTEEILDEHPVSIQVNGEWQTFPNTATAGQAAYQEYKDQLRRNARNFHITDVHLGEGGSKTKFQANINAIRLLKELESNKQQANPEQQEVLSRYVGWGGLADAFDPGKESWHSEYVQLKELLTPEEYAAARSSTLNAHYTSPTVIRAMYEAVERMGFETGNILEPSMGVGNFFGMLPEKMQNSRLYGVELDTISGRIAQQLYPRAEITVAGFETTDRRDFYDLAVGNVPFGQYQVNDKAYNKLNFNIHNYFFAKALDQVRPDGVVAFVTSRYTMDAKDSTVRRYLAQRAELLGAIRLPNNAFKANAGTEVVSDIIFLQKRERPLDIVPEWTQIGQNEDGFAVNSYFLEHPEMVLGRQEPESTAHGMDYTVNPIEGLELADQLHDAVKYIRGVYQEAALPELGEDEAVDTSIPADLNVKNYSYTIVDGQVYYRENSRMVRPDLNATAEARIKGLVGLRDCVQELIDLQMDAAVSDSVITQKQVELNLLYDDFAAKYGLINDRGNRLAFADDSSYYLLCALEIIDEDGKLECKADMFTKRTIKPHQAIASVDTASEALAVSISEKACVDMAYMSQLTGKSREELAEELQGVIFCVPGQMEQDGTPHYVTADEYLSGNVRRKLRQAQRAADQNPAFTVNVEALTSAQPKDLDASEIEVRLGATWIDKEYIQQFMYETFHTPYYLQRNIEVNYSSFTAEWQITGKNTVAYNDVAAYTTYGTSRANAYKILEDSLNLRDVRIYDTMEDADGKERRVLNAKETTLAAQKQQAIREAFRDWIWKDPERRQTLVRQYNEEMNSTRPREYDGSHIIFGGMNPAITLREHQKNAIAHVLYGGNTLLAHEVGAGKTFEMVAAAMEAKRLGLCQKSLFVVPNHLTEQWASEFLRLYPSANILVTTKKDFETHNRKKFCARIATGDYDAIIIGHSQFERIPISRERQERLLREQIDEITDGIEEVQASGGERFTVKQLERTKKSLEARLEKLQAEGRKDDVVTFEQLGIDRLFVDEAHNYKNLFLYTKMRNVAGLSTSDAQKSSDMFAKCRYMDEITGNRGVIFATGTPVSNSMTELYTMQRYLQYERLQELSMTHFDCWASRFGETVTALELAPEGTGYRARTRFSKFFNLPELMNLFKEVADIKTADQLSLPTPEVEYHNVVAQPTEHQLEMVKALSERASEVHKGSVDPSVDNMLKITSDGRKLGLDQRIINQLLPDEPGTKVNQCVDNIMQIWRNGEADKLTQLVFCDISTPQARTATSKAAKTLDNPLLHALEEAVPLPEQELVFTVYDDIRQKLIAQGMPADQIAFIHEANTEVRKKELFSKVRTGQVRVLLGSTAKMGAGTNVQDRLVALHDLDCPWRPGDLAQRKGRIERQGNSNPLVHVYRYVTEGTFDAYLWQTVENKQKFISQIMTSKSPVRSCDDVDETALSFAEIKALCAGDPRIKERMDLDVEVSRLKLMKADHQSKQYRMEDQLLKYFPEEIEKNKGFIKGFEADLEILAAHQHAEDGFAGMEIRGDLLTDKENAGAALLDACKEVKTSDPVQIGSYRGFAMSVEFSAWKQEYTLLLKGEMTHRAVLGTDPRGNLIRIDNALAQMPQRLDATKAQLDNLYQQQAAAKEEVGKLFPYEEELRSKNARLVELDTLLNMDGKGQTHTESVVAKSARPSVLDGLKRPLPSRSTDKKTKSHEEVR